MINKIISLFSSDCLTQFIWSMVCLLVGAFLQSLLTDRFSGFLFKRKHKEDILSSGTPELYTCVLNRDSDIENIKDRLSSSQTIYLGEFHNYTQYHEFSDHKIYAQQCPIGLKLSQISVENFQNIERTVFFLHIENSTNVSISVKEIIDGGNFPSVFTSSRLAYIQSKQQVCLIINDYNRPSQINIDFKGTKLEYRMTEKSGYIKPKIKKI